MISGNSTHQTARRRGTWALIPALAAAVTLALAPSAMAKTEPVAGGKTTLKLKKSFAEFLADTGTKLKAIDPAKDKKSGLQLPIKSGELDSKKVKGTLKHDGGVELKGDGGEAELTKFVAKFGAGSKLTAKVDKKSTALFDLDTDNAKLKVKNGTTNISGVKVILTEKGTQLFEEITDMEFEERDMTYGKLKVAAEPGDLTLDGGDADLTLESAFNSGGITASAIDPATQGAGKFGFPITAGKVSPDGGSGSVRLDGGLRLTKGGTNLDLTKPKIDLAAGEISAVNAGNRGTILSFDADQPNTTVKGKAVTITGIEARLTADGASAINTAFGGSAFSQGQAFGEFEVKGTTG